MLFDTHAHYDDEKFDNDRDEILSSLPAKNVSLVLNNGDDLRSSLTSVALAEKYSFVYAACGVHPHNAKSFDSQTADKLIELYKHSKVCAVGEIGLDYHYDFSPRDVQKNVFDTQLSIAEQLGLPVVIHDREAHQDTLDIIRTHPKLRGEIHCFSASLEMAKIYLNMGWYLAFGGTCTYKNASKIRGIIEYMPLDRILIETDCPYLTPEPYRGQRNDSSFVRFAAEKIAFLKNRSFEEISEITMQNGKKLFGI